MNAVWALDFMRDTLYSGRVFRTLNVIDEANRGALGIDIAVSIPAARVITFVGQMVDLHGRPAAIRCDNGPELTSQTFTDWCKEQDIELRFIQPGKPDQNAYIERFNRTYREEVLSAYLFDSLEEVREITSDWLDRYNEIRPHDALGSLPPARYRERAGDPARRRRASTTLSRATSPRRWSVRRHRRARVTGSSCQIRRARTARTAILATHELSRPAV